MLAVVKIGSPIKKKFFYVSVFYDYKKKIVIRHQWFFLFFFSFPLYLLVKGPMNTYHGDKAESSASFGEQLEKKNSITSIESGLHTIEADGPKAHNSVEPHMGLMSSCNMVNIYL